jgi:putative aldouronate transport system permease protein
MITNKNEGRVNRFASKIVIHSIFIMFALLCVIPIIAILSISFSREADIFQYGYRLIPIKFSFLPYEFIFRNPKQILNAYTVSIIVTAMGGFVGLLITAMVSYPLSRSDFPIRKKLSLFVLFTMLFNGGMVPWYIVVSNILHLKNSILVLILPYLANAWYVLLLRTFFQKISFEIIEAAKIDGSSEYRIFFTIILPLAKPALATVGLFLMLQYWNDWWLAMMFIDKESLVPLQYMLARMMANIEFITRHANNLPASIDIRSLPKETARMGMCVLAAGPMLFVFPFFQKYFVKGLTVGSVKG